MTAPKFTHSRDSARYYQGATTWYGEIKQDGDPVANTTWVNKELKDVRFRGEPTPELEAFIKGLKF
jgi:hypothetical protein